jgi:hypothetical protein
MSFTIYPATHAVCYLVCDQACCQGDGVNVYQEETFSLLLYTSAIAAFLGTSLDLVFYFINLHGLIMLIFFLFSLLLTVFI